MKETVVIEDVEIDLVAENASTENVVVNVTEIEIEIVSVIENVIVIGKDIITNHIQDHVVEIENVIVNIEKEEKEAKRGKSNICFLYMNSNKKNSKHLSYRLRIVTIFYK